LLYPKEDRINNTLMFTCRTCHVGEPATSHCVFQNTLNSQVGDTAGVTTDVGADPTVGLPDFCTYCGEQIICTVCGLPHDSGFVDEERPQTPQADDQDMLDAGQKLESS
jgi:DNA-directed RNA polymerase II subunit RPB9